jgi:segregation and condensation protein B
MLVLQVLEAILFASPRPLPTGEIVGLFKAAASEDSENGDCAALAGLREGEVHAALIALRDKLSTEGRGMLLEETASGWQLVSAAQFGAWVRQLFPGERPARLSPAALETLAIVAYRQPIARSEIEAVRGVAVDGIMQTLLERGLVKIAGRSELPGRPLLYGTTQFFLDHFGVRNVNELPNAAELRRVSLKPPTFAPSSPQSADGAEAPEAAAADPSSEPAPAA